MPNETYGAWRQTGGDTTASVYGAEFARKCEWDGWDGKHARQVEYVQVRCLPGDWMPDDEWDNPDGPYMVDSTTYDPDDLSRDGIIKLLKNGGLDLSEYRDEWVLPYEEQQRLAELRALARWQGEPEDQRIDWDETRALIAWYSWDFEERAVEMARQDEDSFDNHWIAATFKEAMDHYGIPASALWLPSQYDAEPPTYGRECKVCGHPKYSIAQHAHAAYDDAQMLLSEPARDNVLVNELLAHVDRLMEDISITPDWYAVRWEEISRA